MLDVRAIPPDAREDRLAGFRMLADLARQRQQLERRGKIDASYALPLASEARLGFSPSPSWT